MCQLVDECLDPLDGGPVCGNPDPLLCKCPIAILRASQVSILDSVVDTSRYLHKGCEDICGIIANQSIADLRKLFAISLSDVKDRHWLYVDDLTDWFAGLVGSAKVGNQLA